MRQVAEGDRAAFLQIYDRYAPKVFGLAVRMLGDKMAAEEVAQDAFVRLWTRARNFTPSRGKLIAWLLTITRHLALDKIRLDSRRPQLADLTSWEDAREYLADPDSETEEARWAGLRFAVRELPFEQGQAIALAYYQGMSHRQIAESLSLPIGTVKTRIRLGMEKLRRQWLEDGRSK